MHSNNNDAARIILLYSRDKHQQEGSSNYNRFALVRHAQTRFSRHFVRKKRIFM